MPEQLGTLERAASIATESLKKIQTPTVEKAQAEAKSAAEAKAKADVAEKEKVATEIKAQEARAKEDARILSESDETKLPDADKKRKAELVKAKEAEENTPEAKIKRVQEASQKRIDEIKSEMLAKENQTAKKMADLEAKLAELEKPRQQEDIKTKVEREHVEQIAKFVEADKSLPKEKRREMTKDDLDAWYLEDPTEATAWINRREIRRDRELSKLEEAANKKPGLTQEEKLEAAKEFARKQNESKAKLSAKFPGTVPSKEKIVATFTKLGMPLDRQLTAEEAKKVNEAFSNDNAEYKLCMQILEENPKMLESTEGPELVMAEMEKRLAKSGDKSKGGKLELTEDELNAKVEAEIARRKLVDGEGVTSTSGGKKVATEKEKSELRQIQEKAAKKAGITIEQLDKQIERRSNIKGADSGARD